MPGHHPPVVLARESDCPWYPKHLPVVTISRRVRDKLSQRFWVRCWECGLKIGPFKVKAMADMEAKDLEKR